LAKARHPTQPPVGPPRGENPPARRTSDEAASLWLRGGGYPSRFGWQRGPGILALRIGEMTYSVGGCWTTLDPVIEAPEDAPASSWNSAAISDDCRSLYAVRYVADTGAGRSNSDALMPRARNPAQGPTQATNGPDQGIRAIIAYKTIKASTQLGLAGVLLCLWPFGLAGRVESAAWMLHAHATQMWARRLSGILLSHLTERALAFLLLALAADGAFSAFEAFALRRRYAWAPWLVVLATSLLLPFELFELLKEPHLSRLALLLSNSAIAAYLARSAVRERRLV
jgi:uncharacterized membrane protein (DUF2068 family)